LMSSPTRTSAPDSSGFCPADRRRHCGECI
jgi:hypothetical protein